jgi:hypothetical protein
MDSKKMYMAFKNKEILNTGRNIEYGLNKIRRHNKNETTEHFMSKAMLSFLLMNKGSGIITEAETNNGRCIDILQFTENMNFVGYEIESAGNEKKDVEGVDIVEIKLENMPEAAKKGLEELEKWLTQYMV